MTEPSSGYGLWGLVVLYSVNLIFFAFSFFKPQTRRDWRYHADNTPRFLPQLPELGRQG